jgi:hypothetical protein
MTSGTIFIKDGGGAGCLCAGFTGTGVRLLFHDPAKGTRQPTVGRDRCIRRRGPAPQKDMTWPTRAWRRR